MLDLVSGRVRVEQPPTPDLAGADRVAVLAHYAPTPTLSRSATRLIEELSRAEYQVVLVSACEDAAPLRWPQSEPPPITVLRKPNVGYDFGSWAVALHTFPSIARAEHVILVNDSMAGPFSSLAGLLRRCESSSADVYGLTDTTQFLPHLQSYFLGFRSGVLAERPLARFFADVRHETTKWDVVRNYELGLGRLFRREGYGATAAFRGRSLVGYGDNPTIKGWLALIRQGFPFVKRELVRDVTLAPDGEYVAHAVATLCGERIEDWV